MCGIVCVWLKEQYVDPQALEKSVNTLNHRGPDERSIWISSEKSLGMGHARLSIIGIDNGRQPLSCVEHGVYAVVNGEFYGYKDIRKNYEADGYQFLTESDSEVIIPLYLEYGAQLFDRLNGEFSFIIWDEKKSIILAARDRFGVKPLFYSYNSGNFYATSEIKAMVPLGLKVEWDEYAVELILKGVPSQGLSCFKNIKQIKPAHYLIISKDGLREEKYWDFKPSNVASLTSEKEYITQFKEKLSIAIKRRLVADVPVGFYLSGGIDSSAILAIASQFSSNLRAFNISFEDPQVDEGEYAKNVASHIGIDLSSIKVTQKDLANNFSDVIYHRESLVFQANGVAKYLLNKHANESGFKVVLTGEGADEILGGYPPVKEDLAYYLYNKGKKSLLKRLREKGLLAQGSYNEEQLLKIKDSLGFLPSYWKVSFDMGNMIEKCYSDYFKAVSKSYTPMHDFVDSHSLQDEKSNHPVNVSSYIFCKTFFPELVLSYLGDRVEMAHSIEARLPFLDTEFVEFTTSLPLELKIKGEKEKYILYEAMKDLIPESIYKRGKQAITTPSTVNNRIYDNKNPMETLMQDVFHSEDFKNVPFFDQTRTIQLLDSIKDMAPRDKKIPECALNFALSAYFLQKRLITN